MYGVELERTCLCRLLRYCTRICLWDPEKKTKHGGGITPGASQHEEERNAEEILQNTGCCIGFDKSYFLGIVWNCRPSVYL